MWNYRAPRWLPGGHAQTIYAAKWARNSTDQHVHWTRQRWTTPDADFVDVDWRRVSNNNAPLLVLFHGLEGSSHSHYARAFASIAQASGWHIAVPHFRGCSGEPNWAPRAYHSGDYEEIDWMLKKFSEQTSGKLYAVGVSLGGNALMKWAGLKQSSANAIVNAVASVCAPLDLTASGHAIGQGFNRWSYTRMFLASMKPRAQQKYAQYPGLFDLKAVMRAKNLYEFDQAFTAPLHGFANADEYWRIASAKPHMKDIALPALALNARNDPFIPASSLPEMHDVSQHVSLWHTAQGGHVGFANSPWPGHVMAMPQAVVSWLKQW